MDNLVRVVFGFYWIRCMFCGIIVKLIVVLFLNVIVYVVEVNVIGFQLIYGMCLVFIIVYILIDSIYIGVFGINVFFIVYDFFLCCVFLLSFSWQMIVISVRVDGGSIQFGIDIVNGFFIVLFI